MTATKSSLAEHVDNEMARLDQISREICRLYINSDMFGVMGAFAKLNNMIEAGVVSIMSADRMSPQHRESFIRFLQYQAVSFQG